MNRVLIALTACAVGLLCSNAHALDLVCDGQPVATIVLPEKATQTEQLAAATLVKYVSRASGAELVATNESAKPAGVLVSIGRTRLAAAANVSAAGLRNDGYRLVVKNGTLFLLGRDVAALEELRRDEGTQGTRRAVLALLEQLGFLWIQPASDGVFVPELPTVSVPDDLSVTFDPPFQLAHGRFSRCGDWSLANGFRTPVTIYTEGGHTWHTFVATNLWETHPEYFQFRKGKRVKPEGHGYMLCPSNPDVQRLLAEGLRAKFAEGYDWVQLGQSDGYRACECEACKALDKEGQIKEQVHIPHFNAIQAVNKTHPNKKVHLLIYPPTHEPSEHITSYPPNTVLEVCLTWRCAKAFLEEDDEVFTREKLALGHERALEYWSRVAPGGVTVYVYYMGLYHAAGLAPKFTPRMAATEIRRLHRFGVKGIYFCGGNENWGAEGPTYYTIGRLLNDPSRDPDQLLEEYCRGTFGKAAATMLKYYTRLYSRLEAIPMVLPKTVNRFVETYPLSVLDELDGLLDRAKDEAAGEERATNWLRLVDISHRQFSLIARAYHLYEEYEENVSKKTFQELKGIVEMYGALADEVLGLMKSDVAFVRGYFLGRSWGQWGGVRGNGHPKRKSGTLKGPFLWDFEELIKTDSIPGHVVNSGFEGVDLETKVPTHWCPHFKADTGTVTVDAEVFRSGGSSLHIAPDPQYPKNAQFMAYQGVDRNYKPGHTYTYSCYVKTRALKGKASLMCLQYPPPFAPEHRHVSTETLTGDTDWTRLSITFTARPDIASVQIRCRVQSNSGDVRGEAWFDDAELEEAKPEEKP